MLSFGESMQFSKSISSEEGKHLGLVDDVVPQGELVMRARKWALDIAESRKPRVISLQRLDKLEPLGDARRILKVARAQAIKTSPNLPSLIFCLDAIEAGVVSGGYAGSLKVDYSVPTIHSSYPAWYLHHSINMVLNRRNNALMKQLCLQLGRR